MCLPHAGGSASFSFPVAKALAPAVKVLAVQYPGRQDRRHEPPVDNIGDLADRILDALRQLDDRPWRCSGTVWARSSVGVALRMRDAGLPSPAHLFASGRCAPSRYRDESVHQDDRLVSELRTLDCPVTVFTGDRDPRVSLDEARAWEKHTTGPTDLQVLPGGHFFLVDQSVHLIATLTEKLTGSTAPAVAGRDYPRW